MGRSVESQRPVQLVVEPERGSREEAERELDVVKEGQRCAVWDKEAC